MPVRPRFYPAERATGESGAPSRRAAARTRAAPGGPDAALVVGRFERSGLRFGDVADRVVDRLEVLDLVVRDLDAELLLGVDDDGHHRQRVDVEVLGEGLVRLDLVGLDAGLLVDDLRQTREDLLLALRHGVLPSVGDAGGRCWCWV